MPYDKLIKDEMKTMEDAYYKPGAAIAFETEKNMFPYVSKEFNVRTTGDGLRLPPMFHLENAFPEQFLIGFTTRTEFSDKIPQSTLGKPHAGKNMLNMKRFGFSYN